jgi:hypothetical protein
LPLFSLLWSNIIAHLFTYSYLFPLFPLLPNYSLPLFCFWLTPLFPRLLAYTHSFLCSVPIFSLPSAPYLNPFFPLLFTQTLFSSSPYLNPFLPLLLT